MNDKICFKISELSAPFMDMKWELISNGEKNPTEQAWYSGNYNWL